MNPFNRSRLVFVALLLTLLSSACNRVVRSAEKRYPFTGRVVSIDAQAQSAIIDGDAIPGFMEAMAMPYKLKPAEALSHLLPGDSISAEVVVVQSKNDDAVPDYWLENLKISSHSDSSKLRAAGATHLPAKGEEVPDFSFINQTGKRISLKQYRGQLLLLTFIYTRCPFPDFCPRVSNNFAEICKQVSANPALSSAHLLSISLDPEHDSPKVLRDYGYSVAHTKEPALFRRWEFVAPLPKDLPRVAQFFALTIQHEGGTITHNLSTAVIDPEGKILKWYPGGDWQPSDLMKDIANARGN